MWKTLWITLAASLLLTSCINTNSPDVIKVIEFINKNLLTKVGLEINLKDKASLSNADQPIPTPSLEHRTVNAEFLKELYSVVLEREISEEEFLDTMNVLDQGGHYEGVYNGIVYSSEYDSKEKGVATIPALKLFIQLMTQLSLDNLYDPAVLKEKNKEKDVPSSEDLKKQAIPSEAEIQRLKAQFEKEGLTKSNYWMKKKVSEQILKTIDLKKEYREKLASWYGKFVFGLNQKGMSFGLKQRDKLDEYFHYQWALEADEDRIKWECIVRIHMLFNGGAT